MSTPGPLTVASGQTITIDPADKVVLRFDWDAKHLAPGVQIIDSEFNITTISGTAGLSKDNETLLSGNRKGQVRIMTAVAGAEYRVSHKITTNETPSNTRERSIRVKAKEL